MNCFVFSAQNFTSFLISIIPSCKYVVLVRVGVELTRHVNIREAGIYQTRALRASFLETHPI